MEEVLIYIFLVWLALCFTPIWNNWEDKYEEPFGLLCQDLKYRSLGEKFRAFVLGAPVIIYGIILLLGVVILFGLATSLTFLFSEEGLAKIIKPSTCLLLSS